MIDQAQKLRESFGTEAQLPGTIPQEMLPTDIDICNKTTTCKSIAITSGKGGVGKTNICLSLGIALTNVKKKVLVIDADLGLANIHILLGISPSHTLHHYLKKECLLKDVIIEGPGGVHILPGASGIESMANIEPLQLGLLTRDLSKLECEYDFLLIDTGAGIGAVATGFASLADRVFLVVTPEPTSLADAYAMTKLLYKNKDQSVSVLVNMARNDTDGKETFDRLNALVVKFLKRPVDCVGILPFDTLVGNSVRKQSTMAIAHAKSLWFIRIQQCARMLCGSNKVSKKESFFSRLLQR